MHTKGPSKPGSPWLLVVRPRLKASHLSAIKRSATPWLPLNQEASFSQKMFSFQQEGKTWLFCPVEIKTRRDTKWVTMDTSRCKIFPAGMQKTRTRTFSRVAYLLQRAQRVFVLFSKEVPLLSHFDSDTSMSKCGSSSRVVGFHRFYCSGDKGSHCS